MLYLPSRVYILLNDSNADDAYYYFYFFFLPLAMMQYEEQETFMNDTTQGRMVALEPRGSSLNLLQSAVVKRRGFMHLYDEIC